MLPDTPLPCAPHISHLTQRLRWKPESHPRTLLPPFSYPIYSSSLKASPSLICNQLSTCPTFFLKTLYLIIDWLVQLLSWVWLFVTPWPATCQASLTSTIFQSLLKFTSMESVMLTIWPYALSSAFSLSHHQGLFQWFRWPKYLELQL